MIFQPRLARAILRGAKTQTRRPIKPGETSCRYKPGRDYAIQPGRGQAAIGRIEILAVTDCQLGDLTYAEARAEGFRTRDDFYNTWLALHGAIDHELPVWAITFRPVTDPTLFLHRRAGLGQPQYTANARDALCSEDAEVIPDRVMRQYAADARERHDARQPSLPDRLERALARAEQAGVDVRRQRSALERRILAIERRTDQRAA